MEVAKVVIDKSQARQLYREYSEHREHMTPMDREIAKTYRLIAQGRVVIQALESIKQAGLNAQGLPKLAIVRADRPSVDCRVWENGECRMEAPGRVPSNATSLRFNWPSGTFPQTVRKGWDNANAITPLIPVHLRPRTALDSYHILWEAEWRRIPPRDPYLLRRLAGDLWLVVAAWDLTDVERAAMATRMSA